MTEEQVQAMVADLRRQEAEGTLYVHNVEIIFPPTAKAETGLDGINVDIREILGWVAAGIAEDLPRDAETLLHIRDRYYPEREGLEELEDEPDLDALEELVATHFPLEAAACDSGEER